MTHTIFKPFSIDGAELRLFMANLTNHSKGVDITIRYKVNDGYGLDIRYNPELNIEDRLKFFWIDCGNLISTRTRLKIEEYISENIEGIYPCLVKE